MAMMDHALRYAAAGWSVFPCQSGGKRPLTSHGQDDATTDEARIIGWWQATPDANIGIATGPSRLVVLDIDGPQGWAAFAAYPQDPAVEGFTIPPTRTCVTGNGAHLYYHVPPGERARANTTGMDGWAGLDVRGNGYVIAPPSIHPSGHVYAWAPGHHALEPTPAPGFLLATPPATRVDTVAFHEYADGDTRYAMGAVQRATHAVTSAGEGGRNHALNTAAFGLGQLVAGGELTEATATTALTNAARDAGLPQREADRTIQSGLRAGGHEPRQAPPRTIGQELRPRDTAPTRVLG